MVGGSSRLRILVLSYCHPFYERGAEEFAELLQRRGAAVEFLPARVAGRLQVLDALARESYDLVAYFGHGDRHGWLGYLGGFRIRDLLGIRCQKVVVSTACDGLAKDGLFDAPFGEAMVERGLCECFVGSGSRTDSLAGRAYMREFALAFADRPVSVGHIHARALLHARSRREGEFAVSLGRMRVHGSDVQIAWTKSDQLVLLP